MTEWNNADEKVHTFALMSSVIENGIYIEPLAGSIYSSNYSCSIYSSNYSEYTYEQTVFTFSKRKKEI